MECIEPNDCEHFRTVCVSLEVITEGMVRFLLMFQDCLKALLGNVAVAVAVLILFRYLSNGRLGYNHFEALAGRGSIFTDFLLNSYEEPTILGPWLARARFSLIFN